MDANNRFRCTAMALSSHEDGIAYRSLFRTMRGDDEPAYQPDFLMADSAQAITSGLLIKVLK